MRLYLCFLLLLFSLPFLLCQEEKETPYEVLGVPETADKLQIKTAYSKLARRWHPDKNKSPEAVDKMARINWAYKILHNDDKRRRYDILGEESEDFPPTSKPDTRNYLTPTDTVSSMQFMNLLKPHSKTRPYLVYYYHDFCPACLSWTEKWEELRTDFLKLGLGTASIQVVISTQATQFSGVLLNKVPKLGLLVNERVHLYSGDDINMEVVKEFVNPLVPVTVNEVTSSSFLYGGNVTRILNNKPVVLLISPRSVPSIAYKLMALKLQSFCDFYFLSSSTSPQELLENLGVERVSKKLLIYKDLTEKPEVTVNSIDSKGAVTGAIDENKLLVLPRASSPLFFDTICPFGPHARLCLLLVTQGASQYTDAITNSFRQLAYKWRQRDVSMGYFDINTQTGLSNKFYSSIQSSYKACHNGYTSRTILVLYREKADRAQYKLIHGYCGGEDTEELVDILSLKDRALNKVMFLEPLVDESITFLSQLMGMLPRIWEKTMAIFLLPFPLFILSCYLFYGNDRPQRRQQEQGQQQGQLDQLNQQEQQGLAAGEQGEDEQQENSCPSSNDEKEEEGEERVGNGEIDGNESVDNNDKEEENAQELPMKEELNNSKATKTNQARKRTTTSTT